MSMQVIDIDELNQAWIDSMFHAGINPYQSVMALKMLIAMTKLNLTVKQPRVIEDIPEFQEFLKGE